jgi:hypothetical protein
MTMDALVLLIGDTRDATHVVGTCWFSFTKENHVRYLSNLFALLLPRFAHSVVFVNGLYCCIADIHPTGPMGNGIPLQTTGTLYLPDMGRLSAILGFI